MGDINENWIYVCEKSDIDLEDIKRFDYNNNTFCIYHIEDGFFATDGVCTHESVHLEEGLVMDGEIECPMHQGIFDIKTGKAKSPPACIDLKTFPVKIDDDKIYIKI